MSEIQNAGKNERLAELEAEYFELLKLYDLHSSEYANLSLKSEKGSLSVEEKNKKIDLGKKIKELIKRRGELEAYNLKIREALEDFKSISKKGLIQ
jgi:hypothetical protein